VKRDYSLASRATTKLLTALEKESTLRLAPTPAVFAELLAAAEVVIKRAPEHWYGRLRAAVKAAKK
jgi:hypothetical protein